MVDVVGEPTQRCGQRLELEPAGQARHAGGNRCRRHGARCADRLFQSVGGRHGVAQLLGPGRDRFDAGDLVGVARARPDEAGRGRDGCTSEQAAHQPVRQRERSDAGGDGGRNHEEQAVEIGSPLPLTGATDEHGASEQTQYDEHDAQTDARAQCDRDQCVHCCHHPSGASSRDASKPFVSSNATVASRSG